ncbi:MAG: DEAD/DEAH box helicase [Phycisphaerae bacterium]|nr:MAG: DEAD/DEAH box helicase [Phycisphaerae bacterium]
MISLREHQKKFQDFFRDKEGRVAWFAKPGVGKTIGVLATISELKRQHGSCRTLILAPKSVLHNAWYRDSVHFENLNCVVVSGPSVKRMELLARSDCDIFVMGYETFRIHYDQLSEMGFDLFVIDESSKIKNPKSLITKACVGFSDIVPSIILLSGTPAPNSPIEYWPQMRCISKSIFGDNFFRFAYSYFVPKKRYISRRWVISGWDFKKGAQSEFFARLNSRAWFLSKEECLDLPEVQDITIDVELSPEEIAGYMKLLEEARLEASSPGMTPQKFLTSAIFSKLRQFVGGSVITDNGPVVVGDSKIRAFLDLIESIGDDPVVVWAEFRHELDRIQRELESVGKRVGRIDGSTSLSDRNRFVQEFQENKLDAMVCHPAAAGHGITLTAAAYAIYYSHGYSQEQYAQSRDRIHRLGQTKPVVYYHLVCRGTPDEHAMEVLEKKADLSELVFKLLA